MNDCVVRGRCTQREDAGTTLSAVCRWLMKVPGSQKVHETAPGTVSTADFRVFSTRSGERQLGIKAPGQFGGRKPYSNLSSLCAAEPIFQE